MSLRIVAKGLSQSAGAAAKAPKLFEVDIDWKGPGLFVIMGESGGGKSTLLKTLGGVWRPQSGKVSLSDEPLWIGRHENSNLLARMGFCFQNNALFSSMTCLENLCFPHRKRFLEVPEATRRDDALNWLEKVGIGHTSQLFPHELSGGMQKRLSLARSLMLKPDYLFFDDPTAGLDPITSRQIALMLKDLLKEHPALSIIVTNDGDRALEWSDNVYELNDGKLQLQEKKEKEAWVPQ